MLPIWEKISLISALVVTIALVGVIVIFGNRYIQANTEKEIHLRLVEFAIEIIEAELTEDNMHIKKWAVKLINQYTTVRINSTAQQQLVENFSAIKSRQLKHLSPQ